MNILSLRYMASQVSSIHLPYHNVNKFVLIVSNLPRAKFSQHNTYIHTYIITGIILSIIYNIDIKVQVQM
jgi:hypothetical protein